MKLAIPHWQNQISPVFDVADTLLLVDMIQGSVTTLNNITIQNDDPHTLAESIANIGVNVLICGAISRPFESALVQKGIDVIAQTRGQIDEVLDAFLANQLGQGKYLMPGCSRKQKVCQSYHHAINRSHSGRGRRRKCVNRNQELR
ncbi:NifB/NifX family molybdenum-iron cluster-binding protein [Teredinibacter sp. KSP-S5-2]|uniref:NifB/NifX family molybdenum-iron cluster-binding protein n=1 Tax=Teredinibacter sp. KSP-S5-2 TaxID=3034506 RepID=UPI002934FD46|nr:NifB/NifX family molybdenum-iron cluster-binding protein [Teredinibacter sp. KSP-S5-2]WNO10665.1 NifB/NifX family molybdenum-iron cluster-binding protein [Teredinibacter sp. KSP-S5-2]